MSANHHMPAVVVGLNLNGLGVARALGRHGVHVIGLTNDATAVGTRSRFVREIWQGEEQGSALVEMLVGRAEGMDRGAVLLPVTDGAVRAIAGGLDELRKHYRIGMPAPAAVDGLLDKRRFAELAAEHGLPVPETIFVDTPEEMGAAAARVPYPCIMKPQVKSAAYGEAGGKKAYLLDGPDVLIGTYTTFAVAEPRVIVQEYVPGGDEKVYFCLQYYNSTSRAIVSFCGHKIRQWPAHCGGTACCEPVDEPGLCELAEGFFRAVGFRGLCSMEFKKDGRDGAFKAIEPTVCRTDWQSGVADINGVPIPYVAYCDLAGREPPAVKPRRLRIKWVNLQADRQSADYYKRRGELSFRQWAWSLRPAVRGATWAVDDPAPWLCAVAGKLRRRLQALRGRRGGSPGSSAGEP